MTTAMLTRLNRAFVQSTLTAWAALMACTSAQAIDVEAGDYTAAPDGTTLGLIYLQHADRQASYADGSKTPAHGHMRSDVGVLRLIHFMKLGDYIVDPQFLLPFGHLRGTGDFQSLGSNGGLGDLTLAATLWTINDPVNRRYLGFTPFVYAPTGSYSRNEALNMGENRWKYAFQVGYIQGLGRFFTVDLLADVTLHGRNADYGAAGQSFKQDPTYQLQAFGRYQVTPALDLRVGVAKSWVGSTQVDGLEAAGRGQVTKSTVGVGYQLDARTQLLALYGRDLKVTEGLKEKHRINLRVAYAF